MIDTKVIPAKFKGEGPAVPIGMKRPRHMPKPSVVLDLDVPKVIESDSLMAKRVTLGDAMGYLDKLRGWIHTAEITVARWEEFERACRDSIALQVEVEREQDERRAEQVAAVRLLLESGLSADELRQIRDEIEAG
jgi:hypothetical protein